MFTQSLPAELQDQPSPDQRRQSILEAAYALLEEGGHEALTIRAVLSRTGLARRAFYELFEGKDDLILAVFEDILQAAATTFAAEIAGIGNPMDRLKLIVTNLVLGAHAKANRRNRRDDGFDRLGIVLSREHLRLTDSRPAELQNALRPLLGLIADLLEQGMAAGVVRESSPQRMAMLIYNLVSTTLHREYLAPDGSNGGPAHWAALADDLWDFCRRAIARIEGL
jgi:AcrR family transcriptional regulator